MFLRIPAIRERLGGISSSTLYDNIIAGPGKSPCIPGTDVPRLVLTHLGLRVAGAEDDYVDTVVQQLEAFAKAKAKAEAV